MTTVAVAGGGARVGGASAGPAVGGGGAASAAGGAGGLSRAGTSALTGIADPPSPSKPGSMEDAIKLWLKIGNIEKLQVLSHYPFRFLSSLNFANNCSKLSLTVMVGS